MSVHDKLFSSSDNGSDVSAVDAITLVEDGIVTIKFSTKDLLDHVKESSSGKSVGFSVKAEPFLVTLTNGEGKSVNKMAAPAGFWVTLRMK